jgi:hypothetical protein
MECEIIHYPNRNSLAIQGHPELDTYHHEYKEIIDLILNFKTITKCKNIHQITLGADPELFY